MKIAIIHPNVITYDVRQEKSDKDYGSCLWAKFVFDCDSGQLNINSDAGYYAYRWGYSKNEEFMHLMSQIDKDYLLNKISDRSVFKEEKSKKENIKYIKEHGIPYGIVKDGKRIAEIVNEIKDIEDGCSEEFFFYAMDEIPEVDYESIEIVKEYPAGAITITDIFEKYIQPKIKEKWGDTHD